MKNISELIYVIIIISFCSCISVFITENKSGIEKYVKFISSLLVVSMLMIPILDILNGSISFDDTLSDITREHSIEKDITSAVISVYQKETDLTVVNMISDSVQKDVFVSSELSIDRGTVSVDKITIYTDSELSSALTTEIKKYFGCNVIIKEIGEYDEDKKGT